MTLSTSAEQQTEHLSAYQNRDWKIVDYQMYEHEGSGLSFRGPRPELKLGKYVTCLGAAQTLGCFCKMPFPEILQEKLNLEFVNFGYGGAGPRFYLRHPELLEVVNCGRFAIVQVMSGRSEDNRLFESNGLEYLIERSSGERLSADEAYRRLLEQHALGSIPAPAVRVLRMFHAPAELRAVIRETRENWLASYRALFAGIKVPIIFLWFSKRNPGLHRGNKVIWWWQRYDNVHAMFGKFPQLVNSQMMRTIAPEAAHYVECVSWRGSPQRLIDRFTGKPTTINTADDRPDFTGVWSYNAYYPSPEMHEDAASLLEPVCRQLLS